MNTSFLKASAALVFMLGPLSFLSADAGQGRYFLDTFENGFSPNWEKKSFKGTTEYTIIREGKSLCIKAVSNGSASGLYYKIRYESKEKPWLAWKWKVENVLSKGDARSKSGDDYPARVYVIFPSFFFWKTKAINYIWANNLPKGEELPNSYTSNAMMIALQSGEELVGQWVFESRNIYQDYIRCFGTEPPQVGAIAIMTDTDNTGQHATAYYGPISISPM